MFFQKHNNRKWCHHSITNDFRRQPSNKRAVVKGRRWITALWYLTFTIEVTQGQLIRFKFYSHQNNHWSWALGRKTCLKKTQSLYKHFSQNITFMLNIKYCSFRLTQTKVCPSTIDDYCLLRSLKEVLMHRKSALPWLLSDWLSTFLFRPLDDSECFFSGVLG